jgi:hypothetical protein
MAAHTYKGNNTGSTANPIDVTSTQLTADLNLFTSSLQGLVPASGGGTTNFLRADGSWQATVATIGTYDGQTASTNGGAIASGVLYFQSASTTDPGMVNTTTQTFGGAKSFISPLTVEGPADTTTMSINCIEGSNNYVNIATDGTHYLYLTTNQPVSTPSFQMGTGSTPNVSFGTNIVHGTVNIYDSTASGTTALVLRLGAAQFTTLSNPFQLYDNSNNLLIGLDRNGYVFWRSDNVSNFYVVDQVLGLTSEQIRLSIDNVGNVQLGGLSAANSPSTGATYLTMVGSTKYSVHQFLTAQADADQNVVGYIEFVDQNSSAANKIVGLIAGLLDGSTADNRGGKLEFFTKVNGASGPVLAMSINNAGVTSFFFALSCGSTVTATNFISTSSNPATAGILQLASSDTIDWRNNANSANIALSKDTSDNLQWNGHTIISSAGVISSANLGTITLTGDVTGSASGGSIATTLAATSNSTLTTLSGLTTASSLVTVGTITTGTWNAGAITSSGNIQTNDDLIKVNAGSGINAVIQASANAGATVMSMFASNAAGVGILRTEGSYNLILETNNTTAVTIDTSQNVTLASLAGSGSRTVNASSTGLLSASSDSSLKVEETGAYIPGLKEILLLEPKAYRWKDDMKLRGDQAAIEIGFFADQVAPIIPSAAPKSIDGLYAFYDRSVVAALVRSVQELKAEIDALREDKTR